MENNKFMKKSNKKYEVIPLDNENEIISTIKPKKMSNKRLNNKSNNKNEEKNKNK